MAFKQLFGILASLAVAQAAITKRVACAGGGTTANPACCKFFALADDLQQTLFGNECGEDVHESLRLTFHDAIAISKTKGGTGADGSIIKFVDTEAAFHANLGTAAIATELGEVGERHNVSLADLIQFAGALGVSNCVGAPRLKFFAGRKDATAPPPDLLVPEPFDSVDQIVARFQDAGLSASDIVPLLASHSIAASDNIDTSIPGTPFDSTPGVFDSQFQLEVLLKGVAFPGPARAEGELASPLAGEMRIQSDHDFARDSRFACTWQGLINQQTKLQNAFRDSMLRMSILGSDIRKLIDCSDVIPVPPVLNRKVAFPAGKSRADLEQACRVQAFPTLPTDPGAPTAVPPVG